MDRSACVQLVHLSCFRTDSWFFAAKQMVSSRQNAFGSDCFASFPLLYSDILNEINKKDNYRKNSCRCGGSCGSADYGGAERSARAAPGLFCSAASRPALKDWLRVVTIAALCMFASLCQMMKSLGRSSEANSTP